jgi:hypothetical protein
MLTYEGVNGAGQKHWKLHVPDDVACPGLEVGIFSTSTGLMIGGNLISWSDLEAAKRQALGEVFHQSLKK